MIHKNSKLFFDNHKDVDQFFFTPDGQHFFSQAGADAHAITLKRKGKPNKVEDVTRDEVDAAIAAKGAPQAAGTVPTTKELAQVAFEAAKNKVVKCQGKVETCSAKRDAAKDKRALVPKDAKPIDVNRADSAVENAQNALDAALLDLSTAEGEAEVAEATAIANV